MVIFKYIGLAWLIWVLLTGIGATLQERKVWKNPNLPSLTAFGLLKVFIFNILWMGLAQFGVIVAVIKAVITLNFDQRYLSHDIVERRLAQLLSKLLVCPKVEIKGLENLPPPHPGSPAPVFIANHASQIDVAVVYYLNRSWRWIAKSSVFILPGVGQLMFFGGHVFIDRVKKKNKTFTGTRNLYIKSNKSLQEGVPMFFFPQGTRRLGERLPFKDGAFKIAMENNSTLIPISIEIPVTAWNSPYPFFTRTTSKSNNNVNPVVLTVHKGIESKDYSEIEVLKSKCFDTIYSVLTDHSKQS